MNKTDKTFNWNNAKQLTILQLILATFIPSGVAFFGFHYLLPKAVNMGFPILISYAIIASSLLSVFLIFSFILNKKEARDLNITLLSRLCLKRLTLKNVIISILIITVILIFSMSMNPINVLLVDVFNIDTPTYLPFFLNPNIDPATAEPMVLSSGVDLSGNWLLLILLSVTLILNILTEEIYFRAWMLPKLSRFGKFSWLINGVLFASYHTFQLWLFPVILVASLGFAFVTYKMKSIIPPFIAHILLNTLSIISLLPLFLN